MAENRKSPFNRGLPSLILAIATIASLTFFSFYVQPVSAYSAQRFEPAAISGETCRWTAPMGTLLAVACLDNNVYIFTQAGDFISQTAFTSIGNVASTNYGQLGFDGTYLYINDNGVAKKLTINPVDYSLYLVDSVALSTCTGQTAMSVDSDGVLWVTCPTQDKIIAITASTMDTLVTTGSLNGGAHVCDGGTAIMADRVIDVVFVACGASVDKVVMYDINGYTIGTAQAIDSETDGDVSGLAIDVDNKLVASFGTGAGVELSYYDITGITHLADLEGTTTVGQGAFMTVGSLGDVLVYGTTGTAFVREVTGIGASATTAEIVAVAMVSSGGTAALGIPAGRAYSNDLLAFGTGVAGLLYYVDLTGLSGDVGETPEVECAVGAVLIDTNADGIGDMCLIDEDGDGILDFDPNDFPWSAGDPADTIPAFFQVFGFNEDAANLIAAIAIHAFVVFGVPIAWFLVTHSSPPMMAWAILIVFGGGLSAAIGVMPLLYFFVEIALIVGSVAALVKTGVIGG